MNKINLFSIPISVTSKPQALATVSHWLTESKAKGRQAATFSPRIIATPNPEMIVAAQSDPEFLKALQSADLAIPDGIGIVWALKILGYRSAVVIPAKAGIYFNRSPIRSGMTDENRKPKTDNWKLSRLSGLDLMESLIAESAKNGWKVMLLGGKSGVGEKATAALRRNFKFPARLRMDEVQAGGQISNFKLQALAGPVDINKVTPVQLNNLINSINSFSPDLLFVAFGHGKQEKWLNVNRYRLNVGVAMGVGGAFDQIADPSLRPPEFINKLGMGWLYRLLREPWRWKRQLSLIKFILMVINHQPINPSTH